MAKEQKLEQIRYITLDGRPIGANGKPADTDAQHHILNAGVICPVAFGALDGLVTSGSSYASVFVMALGVKLSAHDDTRHQNDLRELFGMADRNEILIDTRPDEFPHIHYHFKDAVLAIRANNAIDAMISLSLLSLSIASLTALEPSAELPEALRPYLLGSTLFSGSAYSHIKRFRHFNKLAKDKWALTAPALALPGPAPAG